MENVAEMCNIHCLACILGIFRGEEFRRVSTDSLGLPQHQWKPPQHANCSLLPFPHPSLGKEPLAISCLHFPNPDTAAQQAAARRLPNKGGRFLPPLRSIPQ